MGVSLPIAIAQIFCGALCGLEDKLKLGSLYLGGRKS